jgi:hypothetical protein
MMAAWYGKSKVSARNAGSCYREAALPLVVRRGSAPPACPLGKWLRLLLSTELEGFAQ